MVELALSWATLSAVPYVIAAGVFHVIVELVAAWVMVPGPVATAGRM
jgi:hypothetical protein